MSLATRYLIRPEHMNHHGCLYAGILSEWLTEAALIEAAGALGSTAGVVLAATKEIAIKRSMYTGTVLELSAKMTEIGTTSIKIHVDGSDFLTHTHYCGADFVFVTVDEQGKKRPHGLTK